MKRKAFILKLDFIIQTLVISGLVISFVLGIVDVEIENTFKIMLLLVGSIQVTSSFVLGFKYNDYRRKNYLLSLLMIQGGGLLIYLISLLVGLVMIAYFVAMLALMIAPIFQLIWCYHNSWLAMKLATEEVTNTNNKTIQQ